MNARLCPDCHTTLEQHPFHGITLDVCAGCAGIWFDAGELDRLRNIAPRALVEVEQSVLPQVKHRPGTATERWCPVCPQPLERRVYYAGESFALDVCPECMGAWVPDGALGRIEACIERARHSYQIAQRPADDLAVELAKATIQHDAFMARQERIRKALTLFAFRPWWW